MGKVEKSFIDKKRQDRNGNPFSSEGEKDCRV
jgi:hypothetical protein